MKHTRAKASALVLSPVLFFFTAGTTLANTHYVDIGNATPAAPYTNWVTAATNIQDAVDTAVTPGDTVLVTNGTYHLSSQINVTNAVTVSSVNGAGVTVVDGQNAHRCLYMGVGAVVDGFTITNGNVTGTAGLLGFPGVDGDPAHGGGVYFNGGGTVRNCTITGNQAIGGDGGNGVNGSIPSGSGGNGGSGGDGLGGGVYGNGGGTILNCLVTGNHTRGGDGGNGGDGAPGGLFIPGGDGGDGLSGGDGLGGGVYGNGDSTISNCTITGNAADFGTGGTGGSGGSGTPNGTPGSDGTPGSGQGGGTYCSGGGTFENAIVYYNSAATSSNTYGGTFSYSCSPGFSGSGNISSSPQFLNTPAGNYRLSTGSPCIDTGTNQTWMAGTTDLDGNPRVNNGTVDIGAYEFFDAALVDITNANATVYGEVETYTIGGANNQWTIGNLWWTNAANGANGTLQVSGFTFQISAIPLAFYANLITVHGSKMVGGVVQDSVTITRNPEHTGTSPIHYVSTLGANTWPYTNWATAATSIHDAVNAAAPGDTVRVDYGYYQPAAEITVAKAITVESEYGADFTTLDGGDAHRLFVLSNGAVVDGFSIVNGRASHGGGIYCNGAVTVKNCAISGNSADYGGGIYCTSTTPVITNCTLSGNSGKVGGGSYSGTLTHCTLTGNSADYTGGGGSYYGTLTYCTLSGNSASSGGGSSYGTLTHCTLTGNSAAYYGGGSEGGTLNNCTLTGNTADSGGGGSAGGTLTHCMLTDNSAGDDGGGSYGGTLTHCTLSGNSASSYGGGSFNGTLTNCIVYGNSAPSPGDNWYDSTPDISWSCTTPGPGGTGNITNNPQLVGYRLMPGSPCIDTGTNLTGIVDDIDGTPRPLDGDADGTAAPDMGAHEFIDFGADSDGDGLPDGQEFVVLGSSPTTAHSDADPADDYEEYVADTDPLDGNDWFRITNMDVSSPATFWFPSSSARQYTLLYSTNLVEGSWNSVPGQIDIMGSGGLDSLSDPSATNPASFYKVQVELR